MKQPGVPTAVTPMTHARQSTKATSTGPKTTTRKKMTTTMNNGFSNTRAALVEYEANASVRAQAWDEAWTTAEIQACQKGNEEAMHPVRMAFYLDTRHINSKEICMSLPLHRIKEIIGRAKD